MIIKNYKEGILNFFIENPTRRVRFREIERELQIPLPSVIRYIRELNAEGYARKEEIGKVIFYSADRSSQRFIIKKRSHNLEHLYGSGLIEYLREEFSNPLIVLFGSYFKGEDTEKSDIDIFIQGKEDKKIELKKYENALGRKIQLFFGKISGNSNKELANSIINGTVLNGYLEVF